MKKLVITAASLMAALNVYAQGTVDFNNLLADPTTGLIRNDFTGSLVTDTDGIVAQLYWSSTMDGVYQSAGAPTLIGGLGAGLEGYFLGGEIRINEITPAGSIAFFEVRAWESAYGSSFDAAVNAAAMNGRVALRGVTDRFMVDTADPTASPPGVPPDIGSFMPVFSVNVPEPSVVALGIIGVGALLMLRRRK